MSRKDYRLTMIRSHMISFEKNIVVVFQRFVLNAKLRES